MMSSLRNKNKKKGFKSSMAKSLPLKIVFSDEGLPIAAPPEQIDNGAITSEGTSWTAPPYLITPSEKQDAGELPPNIFVTAVDVEAGMNSERRKQKRAANAWVDEDVDETYTNWDVGSLSYGEPFDDGEARGEHDWRDKTSRIDDEHDGLHYGLDDFERDWESLIEIADISQLSAGNAVGWKVRASQWVVLLSYVCDTGACTQSYDFYSRDSTHHRASDRL
jgi:hypothetical protein